MITKRKIVVKLSANFERNLDSIEQFLKELEAPQEFDALLDELEKTTIPNLERFQEIGRPFMKRTIRSVEASNHINVLLKKLGDGDLREYVISDYLILYARYEAVIYLLSIKHHRQLSFDFERLWEG
ncbi:MAG: type II toxin-antitoxin system RelE/ParE family toxin [Burkholderiales bacterium]|nr:type II toxin-antitoxin system RelE/ParE family toxin [Burkholderiales bacterium]